MSDQMVRGIILITAARAFLPDAIRVARRFLAAGVRVGVDTLSERARGEHPPVPTAESAPRLLTGEEARR